MLGLLWDNLPLSALVVIGGVSLVVCLAASCVALDPKEEAAFWSACQTTAACRRYDCVFTFLSLCSILLHAKKATSISFTAAAEGGSCLNGFPAWGGTTPSVLVGTVTLWLRRGGLASLIYVAIVGSGIMHATTVLTWLMLWPQSYGRHRHKVMSAGRVLRMFFVVASATSTARVWQEWVVQDMARLAHSRVSAVLLRLLTLHSGAAHLLLHNVLCPLPAKLAAPIYVASTLFVMLQLSPVVVGLVQGHAPVAHAAMQWLCQAVHGALSPMLTAAHTEQCSRQELQVLHGLVGVVQGVLLPAWLIAWAEHSAKTAFLRRRPRAAAPGLPDVPQHRQESELPLGSPWAWACAGMVRQAAGTAAMVALCIGEGLLWREVLAEEPGSTGHPQAH